MRVSKDEGMGAFKLGFVWGLILTLQRSVFPMARVYHNVAEIRYPAVPSNKASPQNAFPAAQVFIMWVDLCGSDLPTSTDAAWPRSSKKKTYRLR